MAGRSRASFFPGERPINMLGSSGSAFAKAEPSQEVQNGQFDDANAFDKVEPSHDAQQFDDAPIAPVKEGRPSSATVMDEEETPRMTRSEKKKLEVLLLVTQKMAPPRPHDYPRASSSSNGSILGIEIPNSMREWNWYCRDKDSDVDDVDDEGMGHQDASSAQEEEEDSSDDEESVSPPPSPETERALMLYSETCVVLKYGMAVRTEHRIPEPTSLDVDDNDAELSTILSPSGSSFMEPKQVRTSWPERIDELRRYKKRYKTAEVPVKKGAHYEPLAKWLANQRSKYKQGRLTAEKSAQLRSLGCPGFGIAEHVTDKKNKTSKAVKKRRVSLPFTTPPPVSTTTMRRRVSTTSRKALITPAEMAQESAPKKRRVSITDEDLPLIAKTSQRALKPPRRLGWADGETRTVSRSPTPIPMEEESLFQLDLVSPPVKKPKTKANNRGKTKKFITWEQRKVMLQDYKNRFGDLDITTNRSKPYGDLGLWLAAQRSLYKKRELTQERLHFLRGIGCLNFGRSK